MIISYGDTFVDYLATDETNESYVRTIGGVAINVAVNAARLGADVQFLGKFGCDETNDFVRAALLAEGVKLDYCVPSTTKTVCGVYVHFDERGERVFHRYVNETPDEHVEVEELQESAAIVHVTSGTLFHPIARATTMALLERATQLRSFDLNIRLARWESEAVCRATIQHVLPYVHVLKATDEELALLTGEVELEAALQQLPAIPYVFVTRGAEGVLVQWQGERWTVPSIPVDVVDTTGAGDAFMAAVLTKFAERLPTTKEDVTAIAQFANEQGALATMKYGAL